MLKQILFFFGCKKEMSLLIGPAGVGKSSLILQFTDHRFDPKMDFTIGVEFNARLVNISDQRIKIQLWDTAGQESFRSITNSYYRGAHIAFLVYDVTRRSSWETLPGWLDEIKHCADPNIVITLVGNKNDLSSPREVTTEEGQAFSTKYGLLFFEASAKTADNVDRAFERAIETVLDLVKKGTIQPQQKSSSKVPLVAQTPNREDTPAKSSCC